MKEKVLFIGANDMREINDVKKEYSEGFFIEPIPDTFELLKANLIKCNETFHTKFTALQYLITSECGKEYTFHIYGRNSDHRETKYGNNGASSSIFEKNEENFWHDHDCNAKLKINSTTMSKVIDKHNINIKDYDIVIDTQGSELEVLKSFGDHIKAVDKITTEISTKSYYKGGVLFPELNSFLNENGLFTSDKLSEAHMNVTYYRKNL